MSNCTFIRGERRFIFLLFICLFTISDLQGQINKYVGTWTTSYQKTPGAPIVQMELQIGTPEKDIIYPASMIIRCDSFHASYDFFLVKKNFNQLGISINKKAGSESPFSMGPYTRFINNVFQYNRDDKKGISMTLHRLPAQDLVPPTVLDVDENFKSTASALQDFFVNAQFNLKKAEVKEERGLTKHNEIIFTGKEFGLLDTVHVGVDTIGITIPVNRKNDTDTVSVALNGGTLVLEADIKKKTNIPFLELTKGENIVVLFADNYGSLAANGGRVLLDARTKNIALDFSSADPFATFVVARLFFYPVKDTSEKRYETNTYIPASMTVTPTRITYDKATTANILQRSTTVMGEMETKSAEITLALWDDALEDGDTISLNINGKWLVQGFSVKKATQFINVQLNRGPNKITFIAENLGSIPPNTSVLEIIDGKKRRSFKIETTLTSNNAINIFYDFKP